MNAVPSIQPWRTPGRRLVTVCTTAITLSGCALGQKLAIEPIPIASDRLQIWTATASDLGDRVLVYGLLRGRGARFAPAYGHLHVEARLTDSSSPVWSDARWSRVGGPKGRRGRHSGRFSATLPIADASRIEQITVAYVARPHGGL